MKGQIRDVLKLVNLTWRVKQRTRSEMAHSVLVWEAGHDYQKRTILDIGEQLKPSVMVTRGGISSTTRAQHHECDIRSLHPPVASGGLTLEFLQCHTSVIFCWSKQVTRLALNPGDKETDFTSLGRGAGGGLPKVHCRRAFIQEWEEFGGFIFAVYHRA